MLQTPIHMYKHTTLYECMCHTYQSSKSPEHNEASSSTQFISTHMCVKQKVQLRKHLISIEFYMALSFYSYG
jgi:hypothetical protein